MSEYIHESKQVGRFLAEVLYDEDGACFNPRTELRECNTADLSMTMRGYSLPNELDIPFDELDSIEDVRAWVRRELGPDLAWMGTVSGYSHGGVKFRVSDSHDYWDGGFAGVVTLRKSRIRYHAGVKRITAKTLATFVEQAVSEVDYYSAWGEGEVYYYRVTNTETDEVVDSCGGYIGDEDLAYAFSEAVRIAEDYEADAVEDDVAGRESAAAERRVVRVQPALDNLGVAV